MKTLLLAAVGFTAVAIGPASAADLPARAPAYTKAPAMAPIYDWAGFYVGFNAGGASSRECYTLNSVAGVALTPISEGLPQRNWRAGRRSSRLPLADDQLGVWS